MFVRQGVTKSTYASPVNAPNVGRQENSRAAESCRPGRNFCGFTNRGTTMAVRLFLPPVSLEAEAEVTNTQRNQRTSTQLAERIKSVHAEQEVARTRGSFSPLHLLSS